MKKYNIKELEEKLNKCKKMSIKGINPNDIDNLEDIKIDRRKEHNERKYVDRRNSKRIV